MNWFGGSLTQIEMTIERWIIAGLVIFSFIAVNRCQKNASNAEFNMSMVNDTIRHYQDREGNYIAQVKTLQGTVGQLKENAEALGLDLKAIKKQVGSLHNLVAFYKAKAEIINVVTINNHDTVYVDSAGNEIPTRLFTWSNQWMRIKGESNAFSTKLEYKYSIEWELVTYMKKSGFLGLGKSTMVSDLKFTDPSVQTREFKAIQVPYKKSIFEKWWLHEIIGAAGMYFILRGGGP